MLIYIYRGLPGSGKNTHAEEQGMEFIIDYEFVPEEATEAHSACFRRYLQLLPRAVEGEVDSIAVCNTNTTRAEYTPYVQAARAFGLGDRVRLIHCDCSVETSVERNIHGVPRDVIEKMDERWEEPLEIDPPQHTIPTDP